MIIISVQLLWLGLSKVKHSRSFVKILQASQIYNKAEFSRIKSIDSKL